MIIEDVIENARSTLPADLCDAEPQRVGQRAARFGTEVLIDELRQRGYSRASIIDGLKEGLAYAETGSATSSA